MSDGMLSVFSDYLEDLDYKMAAGVYPAVERQAVKTSEKGSVGADGAAGDDGRKDEHSNLALTNMQLIQQVR
jgi:hypothetical protein